MAMEKHVTKIKDLDVKPGDGWNLYKATGANGKKYKTFDDKIGDNLKIAKTKQIDVEIEFEAEQKEYNGKPYVDRTIKNLVSVGAHGGAQPAPAPGNGNGKGTDLPPGYWDKKQLLDFKRNAMMNATNNAFTLLAACIQSQIENYKYEDAVQIAKKAAKEIYAANYALLEEIASGNDHHQA